MKELDPIIQDKTEVSVVKPIIKEKKLLGKVRPHKGHILFELDLTTGIVYVAQFKSVETKAFNKDKSIQKVVIAKENHIYATALNLKNATKRFKKMLIAK